MQVLQVHVVDAVLGHFLDGGVDRAGPAPGLDVAGLLHLRDRRQFPLRVRRLRVVPGPDQAVALLHRQGAQDRLLLADRRHHLGVGDVLAETFGVVLPVVEGAADVVAHHRAAMAEVRAQMRTVGIADADLAALAAEHDPFLVEEIDVFHFAGLDAVRIRGEEPAGGNGEGIALQSLGLEQKLQFDRSVHESVLLSGCRRGRRLAGSFRVPPGNRVHHGSLIMKGDLRHCLPKTYLAFLPELRHC